MVGMPACRRALGWDGVRSEVGASDRWQGGDDPPESAQSATASDRARMGGRAAGTRVRRGTTDEGGRRDGGRAERIGRVLGWDVTDSTVDRATRWDGSGSDAMTDYRVLGLGRESTERGPLRANELGCPSPAGLLVVSMATDCVVVAACVVVAYGRVPSPSNIASTSRVGFDAKPTNGGRRSAID